MRAEKLSRPWVDDDIAGRQPLDPLRPGRSRGWTMRDEYPAAVRAEVIAAAAAVAWQERDRNVRRSMASLRGIGPVETEHTGRQGCCRHRWGTRCPVPGIEHLRPGVRRAGRSTQ